MTSSPDCLRIGLDTHCTSLHFILLHVVSESYVFEQMYIVLVFFSLYFQFHSIVRCTQNVLIIVDILLFSLYYMDV